MIACPQYRDLETDIYKTAVEAGVLNGGFSRNQLGLCPQTCLLKIKTEMSVSIGLCLCGHQSHRSRQEGRKGLKSVTAVVPKIAKQCAANAFKQKYCADPGAIYMEATAGQTNK